MNDDFWDKFPPGEDDTTSSPPRHKRVYVGGITSVVLLTLGSIGVLGLFPFQYQDQSSVVDTTPPPAAEVAEVEGRESPALEAVTTILKNQFTETNNLKHAAVGEEQIARTLPGQNGCTAIAPTASGLQGYSGGSWRDPVGITITVNAYGPGLGATALKQLTEDCSGVSANEESPGVITGDIQGSSFRAWHYGDVVVSITATNTDIPAGLIKQVDDRVSENLKNVCAAPVTDGVSLSSRNPYYDLDAFTGLLVSEEVSAEDPSTEMEQPDIEPLPDVTRPDPPAFPYYPTSLPDPVEKPDIPQVPEYPETSKTISYQVEDAEGPGCGWNFTNTNTPIFDADQAEKKRQEAVTTAQKDMKDAFTRYDSDVEDWVDDWIDFENEEKVYRDYADEVSTIADQWDDQKDAQDQYQDDLDDYNDSVDRREEFLEDQREAQGTYDADVQTCEDLENAPSPTPTATPEPSDGGGETPTASPTPEETTSTPQMECPPERPAILDQEAPEVLPQPTPPADPRPEGER